MFQQTITNEEALKVAKLYAAVGASEAARQLGMTRNQVNNRVDAAKVRGLIGLNVGSPVAFGGRQAKTPDAPRSGVLGGTDLSSAPHDDIAVTGKTVGRPLGDFRAAHDKDTIVPAKFREALKKLGGGWLYDEEFRKLAGLSTADFARYRDQFLDHVVIVKGAQPKKAWAGTKDLAAKMRAMVEA
jgi:hypothetical protein